MTAPMAFLKFKSGLKFLAPHISHISRSIQSYFTSFQAFDRVVFAAQASAGKTAKNGALCDDKIKSYGHVTALNSHDSDTV